MNREEYNIRNIRTLLVEGFSIDELLRFINDEPGFESFRRELPGNPSPNQIVDLLIPFALRMGKMEQLLSWAHENNPTRYAKHQPYYLYTYNGSNTAYSLGQKLLCAKIDKKLSQQLEKISEDSWALANIKSDLHAQSEVLAREADDLAKLDKDEIYYGMVPLSVALRWNRGYDLFLQNLLNRWCQSKKEGLDSVTNALSRNRKALIPLIARWKLPGSKWLLPDEEAFPAKVGESFLDNGVPDYNGREALLRVQAELAQEEGVTEEIFRMAQDQVRNPPQTEFMNRLDEALQFAPKEIQNLRERFDDN